MVEEPEKEVVEGYANELSELTSNAKPRINLLTMLADENQEYAASIVRLIENQMFQVSKWRYLFPIDKFYVFVKFCKYFRIHIFSLLECMVSRFFTFGLDFEVWKRKRRTENLSYSANADKSLRQRITFSIIAFIMNNL